ncbi:glycosyltransferase family 4 protein [Okeanomitos corallinicola TIOX110]|uniref:Glycosyltransferase family 4 protein n=1 Tax=Okeanomitos corallinicola TIOX110 TaxID=3133117 RepID=A0ABZ2UWX9_9CYAN
MRVLHIYAGNLFGGIETLLITLAREQNLCPQMQHYFALCFEGRLADELRSLEANVQILGKVRFSRPWTVCRARQQLQKSLKHLCPHVVICHELWTYCLAAPVISRQQLPLVFWMHGWGVGNRWYEILARRIPPDLAIVNSHYTNKTLPLIFPGYIGHVLYNPVKLQPLNCEQNLIRESIREVLQTKQNAIVIVITSRMAAYKGHLVLLEALGQLQKLPDWILWIAGGIQQPSEQEYFVQLKKRVVELGISNRVKFLGERSDIPNLLMASDIHCQPNIGAEPFGIAFIEALYAGLPVITTEIGAAVEIITESCGILIPPEDVIALANALSDLIKNPNKRYRLGVEGLQRARELSDPTKILGQLHDVLASITLVN